MRVRSSGSRRRKGGDMTVVINPAGAGETWTTAGCDFGCRGTAQLTAGHGTGDMAQRGRSGRIALAVVDQSGLKNLPIRR